MKIDAVSMNYSDTDEPETLYNHVPLNGVVDATGETRLISTLCGTVIHVEKVLWYDGLSSVDCPQCLYVVALAKSVRISKNKLPEVKLIEP